MRHKNFSVCISVMCLGLLVVSCSKPVKTMAYFKTNYPDFVIEAKRCIGDVKNNKSIDKDETCRNVAAISTIECKHLGRMNGAEDRVNCDDYYLMLSVAAAG